MRKSIIGLFSLLLIMPLGFCAAQSASVVKLIQARGLVNTKEIGGSGLCVFSLWDKHKCSALAADGSFSTVISGARPQKISLNDSKGSTRALAIALPEDSDKIIFDAKSTAAALLFQDANLFRDSQVAKNYFMVMEKKKSFHDLVVFFQQELPSKSLEELNNDAQCVKLLDRCSSEIFGNDPAAIRNSLEKAKIRLEELFKE